MEEEIVTISFVVVVVVVVNVVSLPTMFVKS